MDATYCSALRVALLVEITLLAVCYWYNPVEHWKVASVQKEYALYFQRKKLLTGSIAGIEQKIESWKKTPLQKESFAREHLNMARPDEIVYVMNEYVAK